MPERSQQEGHCQSHRINRQQQDPLGHGVLGRGKAQDDGQDRAHARRPAKSKGKADQKCSPGRAAALHAVQPRVGVQRLDLEQAGQMQSKQNNDHAGHLRQHRLVARQQLPDFGRDRAQRNEDHAETQNEADRNSASLCPEGGIPGPSVPRHRLPKSAKRSPEPAAARKARGTKPALPETPQWEEEESTSGFIVPAAASEP